MTYERFLQEYDRADAMSRKERESRTIQLEVTDSEEEMHTKLLAFHGKQYGMFYVDVTNQDELVDSFMTMDAYGDKDNWKLHVCPLNRSPLDEMDMKASDLARTVRNTYGCERVSNHDKYVAMAESLSGNLEFGSDMDLQMS